MRGTELVPQVVGNLLDAHFVSGATQIEEAVVHTATALDEVVGGDPGVETAGDEAQHILLGRQRITAETGVDLGDQIELVILNLQIDLAIRILQPHPTGDMILVQAATDVALHLDGGELMFAVPFDPHAEGLARQLITIQGRGVQVDVVQLGETELLHLEETLDTRRAREHLDHGITHGGRIAIATDHQLVPIHAHAHRGVDPADDVTNISLQHLDHALADRLALDGDFRE